MADLRVLRPDQRLAWQSVLNKSFQYDAYHLPSYHALAEERGEGQAHLFVYSEGPHFVALPLLLRKIETVPGLAAMGGAWQDATSVYGYAGPVASSPCLPALVLSNFQVALCEALEKRHIVSVFSRLHPLVAQRSFLLGLGDYVPQGETVSIDLTLPVDVQRARYRKDHKYGVNKLRRLGVTCLNDQEKDYLDEFIDIYYETMHRVNASSSYLFDHKYFERLVSAPDLNVELFVCLLENKAICAGLFMLCDGIVQFHLSGTRTEYYDLAPTKLLVDTVRLWAVEHQLHVFHLGGGVGSRQDSLFRFKAGFSDQRQEFAVWHWMLLPDVYDRLCQTKAEWNKRHGSESAIDGFFPAYRCPTVPTQGNAVSDYRTLACWRIPDECTVTDNDVISRSDRCRDLSRI